MICFGTLFDIIFIIKSSYAQRATNNIKLSTLVSVRYFFLYSLAPHNIAKRIYNLYFCTFVICEVY